MCIGRRWESRKSGQVLKNWYFLANPVTQNRFSQICKTSVWEVPAHWVQSTHWGPWKPGGITRKHGQDILKWTWGKGWQHWKIAYTINVEALRPSSAYESCPKRNWKTDEQSIAIPEGAPQTQGLHCSLQGKKYKCQERLGKQHDQIQTMKGSNFLVFM